jgi:hypothetical protein
MTSRRVTLRKPIEGTNVQRPVMRDEEDEAIAWLLRIEMSPLIPPPVKN